MAIIDLQRRLREAGRIRIGEQKATSNGKTRPAKLDTFRVTSSDKKSLDAIAATYGGTVDVWDKAPVGIQYEVYTETTMLDVIVPPVDLAFSQFMELWSGGGCVRRCDGQTNLIDDKPCACDPDNVACKPTTRLGVILTSIQGIGMWRLEVHGWNAAQELNGAIEILRVVQSSGNMIPARLMLEQRQSKRDGKTLNYVVPVLDLNLSSAALTSASARHAELTNGHVTPISRDKDATLSLQQQMQAVDDPDRLKKNRQVTLPPTGLAPRPVGTAVVPDVLPEEQTLPVPDGLPKQTEPKTKATPRKTKEPMAPGALRSLFAIKDRAG